MSYKDSLLQKLEKKEAHIGIIGLGYVGLPLAMLFITEGYSVIGFDIDSHKVEAIKKGKSYIQHIDFTILEEACRNGSFLPTSDYSKASDADALILCVPTPLTEHREPDISYVIGSIESVLPYLKAGQVVVLESTTYPGTTEEELRPRIQSAGFTIGTDFFLVYSPEREDPGNPVYSTKNIPKVCGGSTPECLSIGLALYGKVIQQIIPVSSTQTAEMIKILENTFRSVNIALVNEMKMVADRMGVDIFEVIRAASTKPFGYMPFYPGPGLGGHCIPIDPFYLTWKAREYGIGTRFIELAGEINVSMPDYVVSKIMDGLNTQGKAMNGSKILLLGLAYKKNVDDIRESPSVALIDKLIHKGAIVHYSDPYIPVFPKMRRYHFDLSSIAITPEALAEYDCVLIATDHDRFDWEMIKKHAKMIVDPRGVYDADGRKIIRS